MSNPSAKSQGRQSAANAGYEKRDANAKWIFGIVAFLLCAGLLMHLCLAGVMERLGKKSASADEWAGLRRNANAFVENKAVPRLQIQPKEDLNAFRAREEAELNSYGWIDRTAGVVRIPISRAIDLLVQRGLPARAETNQNGLGPSSYELQQQRPLSRQPEIQGEK